MGSSRTLLQKSQPDSSYSLLLTSDPGHVRAAQELRYRIFATEFGLGGSSSDTPAGTPYDEDRFDAHCEHLVVRDDLTGAVVGTYRLLPPEGAAAAGGLYSDGEFDLRALDPIRGDLVEAGRSCVEPEHRTGGVVGLVWAGIGRYLQLRGYRWLVGCASVSLADGGATAAATWRKVADGHLAPDRFRAVPHRPWDLTTPVDPGVRSPIPPLLRGYLRLGTWVCGPPAHDPDFDCADFPILLGLDHMDQRYARHFLGEEPTAASAPIGSDAAERAALLVDRPADADRSGAA